MSGPVTSFLHRLLIALGLLATISAAGCTAKSATSGGAPADGQPASSASTSPAATPASTPSADAIENLVADNTVRSQLTSAYVAYMHISPADVAGFLPNSIYYAYDPAKDAYWALATFVPSKTAPLRVLVNFQDGGNIGIFTRAESGTWQVKQAGIPPVCNLLRFFPRNVLTTWSMPTEVPAGIAC
jgi:hypothetical protein